MHTNIRSRNFKLYLSSCNDKTDISPNFSSLSQRNNKGSRRSWINICVGVRKRGPVQRQLQLRWICHFHLHHHRQLGIRIREHSLVLRGVLLNLSHNIQVHDKILICLLEIFTRARHFSSDPQSTFFRQTKSVHHERRVFNGQPMTDLFYEFPLAPEHNLRSK